MSKNFLFKKFLITELKTKWFMPYAVRLLYDGVLTSPDVVGRNRQCRWKEESLHVPNCKSFLVTESERKYVRRRAVFQQHREASCHNFFSCKARRLRKFTPFS